MERPAFFSLLLAGSLILLIGQAAAQVCTQTTTLPRPVPMGVCGGNINDKSASACGGGTLGAVVQNTVGTQFILSVSHVFARCNAGVLGDGIVQPALPNVNCSQINSDIVANLSKFTTISLSGTNSDDAAIAKIISGKAFASMLNIGPISSIPLAAFDNLPVEKMGCGSCQTRGSVLLTGIFGTGPGCGTDLKYSNLIEMIMRNAPGDSGSVVVSQGPCFQPVGLIIGGVPSSNTTLAIPIGTVLSDMSVSVVGGTCHNVQPMGFGTQTGPSQDELNAREVVAQNADSLLEIPGVFLVGVGTDANGQTIIVVTADELTPEVQSEVPPTLGGFPVVLEAGKRPIFY